MLIDLYSNKHLIYIFTGKSAAENNFTAASFVKDSSKKMGVFLSHLRTSGYQSVAKILELFQKGRNINSIDNNGASFSQPENAKETKGWSPLHSAITGGKVKIVKHLIENSASLSENNANGYSPLTSAIEKGHVDIAHWARISVELKLRDDFCEFL